MTYIILSCVAGYFFGSLPFGLWVGLLWRGIDIRTLGSKNIGATNVLRVLGPGPGLTVFVLDILKGAVGIWLALALWPHFAALHTGIAGDSVPFHFRVLIGLVSVLGHTFSVFLKFKGGKGIATSFGVLIAASPPVAGCVFGVWVLFVAVTRYVSVASLAAALTISVSSIFLETGVARIWMISLGVVLLVLTTIKHRANIQRLRAGTEPKFGQRAVLPAEPSADPVEVAP